MESHLAKKTDTPEIRVPFNPVLSMETRLSPSTSNSQYCGSSFLDSSNQEMLSISQLHGSGNQPSDHQQFTPVPPPLIPVTSVVTAANINLQTISGGTCNVIFSNAGVTASHVNTQSISGGSCNTILSCPALNPAPYAMNIDRPPNYGVVNKPFYLHFISGNISRCAGCKQKYVKPSILPYNLCVQHEEWRQLTFPSSSSPSNIFSNGYYHLNLQCIRANWPYFMSDQLIVPPSMHGMLLPQHWDLLHGTFGILRS